MKTTVSLIKATVRKDAHTINPVTVPPYELPILRNLFGKENVQEIDAVRDHEVDTEGEFERLCAKYGSEVVQKVFGDDGGERLAELVERSAKKKASAAKAPPKTSTAGQDENAKQPA